MNEPPDLLEGIDLPSEPQQNRSASSRQRLKTAGLEVFGKRGYEAASINEIALKADVAVGGFYRHFRSKRQLLLVLMDDLLQELYEVRFQRFEGDDLKASLKGLLTAALARDLAHIGAYRAWHEAIRSDEDLAAKDAEIRSWTNWRLTQLFAYLMSLQEPRPGINIGALVRVIDQLLWNLACDAAHGTEVEVDQLTTTSAHIIYNAIFTDSPEKKTCGTVE